SNKFIRLEAAKGKSLQAMVASNSIYNTATGDEIPLTVTIDGKTLGSNNTEILAKDDNKAAVKNVLMDVSATSNSEFAEGDYRGTM
ncbi:hypothetical protein R0J91_18325, partial [Micrococcus sp. SIMBA_131]